MPDSTVTDMPVPRPGPALSATSDAAVIDLDNAQETDIEEAARLEAEAKAKEDGKDPKEAKAEKEDTTPPAVKAQITKERNRRRASDEALATERAEKAQLLAELETLRPKPTPVTTRPNRADFSDPDEYDAAMIGYGKEVARAEAANERSEAAKHAAEQESKKLAQNFRSQVEEFTADHPDFEDVFTEELPITIAMSHAIMSAENSAELAYWLGKNPDEAKRISGLSDVRAIYELGRVSTALTADEEKPAPKVAKPAPIKPLGTRSGDTAKDPAEMSTEEYAAHRNAQLRAERGNGASAVH